MGCLACSSLLGGLVRRLAVSAGTVLPGLAAICLAGAGVWADGRIAADPAIGRLNHAGFKERDRIARASRRPVAAW